MSVHHEMRARAELQHGVLSLSQAYALGATRSMLRNGISRGAWDTPTRHVLRCVGAPRTAHQEIAVAVLDSGPGAAAGHTTAAALWRLPGFNARPLEVVRQRGISGRRSSVARVRQCRLLPSNHCTELAAIPVTTLGRTMFDLAADISPARLERLVDTVVSRSPVMLGVLHALLDELGERGRNGIANMRSLLDERPLGYVAPASGLEARFARILAEAGEPALERQVDVGGREWLGRVDFVDRTAKLLVEIDSALHHTSKLDRHRDQQRDRALLAAGWRQVLRIPEEHVWRKPWKVVSDVRRARASWYSAVAG